MFGATPTQAKVIRIALKSSVSLLPIIGLLACTTIPASDDYELCSPVPPATDCGDDIPVEVE